MKSKRSFETFNEIFIDTQSKGYVEYLITILVGNYGFLSHNIQLNQGN